MNATTNEDNLVIPIAIFGILFAFSMFAGAYWYATLPYKATVYTTNCISAMDNGVCSIDGDVTNALLGKKYIIKTPEGQKVIPKKDVIAVIYAKKEI